MRFKTDTKILVVDDYKTMLRIHVNLLKQLGFKGVTTTLSGRGAIDVLAIHDNFGLIISDWNMEPMSGLELLRAVRDGRGGEAYTNVPFIMVTAESKTENVIAAKEAGVTNYIVKPFNAATLRAKLSAIPSLVENSDACRYCGAGLLQDEANRFGAVCFSCAEREGLV